MKPLLTTVVVCIGFAATAIAQPPNGGEFGRPRGGPGGPPANAMFNAIDADSDGAINMRELRKAVVALKKLDVDKDGKITLAETLHNPAAATNTNLPSGVNGQRGLGNGPGGFGGANGGDPRPTGPNMMQYDRNGDGQLSADEVPTQLRGMLRGTDQDNNGTLDAQEMQAIQQRMNERLRGQRPLPPGISVGPQGVERTPK